MKFDKNHTNGYSFKLGKDFGFPKWTTATSAYKFGYTNTTGNEYSYVFVSNKKEIEGFDTEYSIEIAKKQPTGYVTAADATKYFTIEGMTIKAAEGLKSGDAIGKKVLFHVWAHINDAAIAFQELHVELTKVDESVQPEKPVIDEIVLDAAKAIKTTGTEIIGLNALSNDDYVAIANKLGESVQTAKTYTRNYQFFNSKNTVATGITANGDKFNLTADIKADDYKMVVEISKDGKVVLKATKAISVVYDIPEIEKIGMWWQNGICIVEGRAVNGTWNMEVALQKIMKVDANKGSLKFEIMDANPIVTNNNDILKLKGNVDLTQKNEVSVKAKIVNKGNVVIAEEVFTVRYNNPLPNNITYNAAGVYTLYNAEDNNKLTLTGTKEEAAKGKCIFADAKITLESAISEHKAIVTNGNLDQDNAELFGATIEFSVKENFEGRLSIDNSGVLTWDYTRPTGAQFNGVNAIVKVVVKNNYATKTIEIPVHILPADKVPAEK